MLSKERSKKANSLRLLREEAIQIILHEIGNRALGSVNQHELRKVLKELLRRSAYIVFVPQFLKEGIGIPCRQFLQDSTACLMILPILSLLRMGGDLTTVGMVLKSLIGGFFFWFIQKVLVPLMAV